MGPPPPLRACPRAGRAGVGATVSIAWLTAVADRVPCPPSAADASSMVSFGAQRQRRVRSLPGVRGREPPAPPLGARTPLLDAVAALAMAPAPPKESISESISQGDTSCESRERSASVRRCGDGAGDGWQLGVWPARAGTDGDGCGGWCTIGGAGSGAGAGIIGIGTPVASWAAGKGNGGGVPLTMTPGNPGRGRPAYVAMACGWIGEVSGGLHP